MRLLTQMEQQCLVLSGAALLTCTFNCSTVSDSDWFVQHGLTLEQGRETYVHPRDLLLLHFLCAVGRLRLQICQMEAVTLKLLEDMALTQMTAWLTRHMLDLTCLPIYHIL